jgi:calcineurin-like phosphoesterase family protein
MKITLETGQKLWFTSDTHYGHTNICRGVSKWKDFNGNVPIKQTRDFKTLYHMNDAIVESINNVVGENDILFHLGDWSFGGFENIAEFRNRIVCKNIHLILGNHDHHIENNRDDIQDLFSSVNQYLRLQVSVYPGTVLHTGKVDLVLMHYPIASWHNMNDNVIHLHGHVHLPPNKKLAQGKAMDVGVDGNGLIPYSLNEITRIMDKQPITKLSLPQDHHEERIEGNGGNKKGGSKF